MARRQALFLVLEGADGSGKATQFKLLSERLKAMGYELEVFDFPRYEEPSSYFVRHYLNGFYGPANSISPYTASIFYALDRYEAAPAIKKALNEGKIVLANRYVGSNMAHQGSKFSDSGQQRGFFVWEDGLEYSLLGIPRPDINLFLRVPAEIAYELIGRKNARSYTNRLRDEHEADIEHLRKSVETYDTLSRLFPKDFKIIECAQKGKMLSIVDINNRIWQVVSPLLPVAKPRAGKAAVVHLDKLHGSGFNRGSSIKKDTPGQRPLLDGHLKLQVKNLSNFAANNLAAASGVLVKQSINIPSNSEGYYRLPKLGRELKYKYNEMLDFFSTSNKIINQRLENDRTPAKVGKEYIADLVLPLLPLSALTDVEVSGAPESIQSLVDELSLQPYEELKWLSKQIAVAAQEQNLQIRTPQPGHAVKDVSKMQDYIELFLDGSIKSRKADDSKPVRLLGASPRNEFESIIESLYSKLDISREEIATEVFSWPYERKVSVLTDLLASDYSLSDKISYSFNISASLLRLRGLFEPPGADIRLQTATIRYGYDLPVRAQPDRLEDMYEKGFDLSRQAYESFRAAGREELLPYITLLGHRRNMTLNITLKQLKNAVKKEPGMVDRTIINEVIEKVAEMHPLIAETIDVKAGASVSASSSNALGNRRRREPRAKKKLSR